VTKYKRIYRAAFRMSQLRSEAPVTCRFDHRRPVGSTPSLPADSPAHSYPVEMAGKGGRARAADRDEHMRA
jgi:hypothetical protein